MLEGPALPMWAGDVTALPPLAVVAFAYEAQCPDCPSEVADIVQSPDGVWHVITRHAETCPDPTSANVLRNIPTKEID